MSPPQRVSPPSVLVHMTEAEVRPVLLLDGRSHDEGIRRNETRGPDRPSAVRQCSSDRFWPAGPQGGQAALDLRRGSLAGGGVNNRVNRVKRIFKWGMSEELVPSSVFEALRTVAGLRCGRTEARKRRIMWAVPAPESHRSNRGGPGAFLPLRREPSAAHCKVRPATRRMTGGSPPVGTNQASVPAHGNPGILDPIQCAPDSCE